MSQFTWHLFSCHQHGSVELFTLHCVEHNNIHGSKVLEWTNIVLYGMRATLLNAPPATQQWSKIAEISKYFHNFSRQNLFLRSPLFSESTYSSSGRGGIRPYICGYNAWPIGGKCPFRLPYKTMWYHTHDRVFFTKTSVKWQYQLFAQSVLCFQYLGKPKYSYLYLISN